MDAITYTSPWVSMLATWQALFLIEVWWIGFGFDAGLCGLESYIIWWQLCLALGFMASNDAGCVSDRDFNGGRMIEFVFFDNGLWWLDHGCVDWMSPAIDKWMPKGGVKGNDGLYPEPVVE